MAEWISVPLGIDIGSTRVRIAAGERNRFGDVRIRAVVSRDLPDDAPNRAIEEPQYVAAAIDDLLGELGGRERRAVLGIGAPAATVRYVKFPKMSWAERLRAARFESQRWAGFDSPDVCSTVRVHPVPNSDGVYAVGAAIASALERRVGLAAAAGIRVVAVDYEACALRRLFPEVDAVVDVGADRSTLHAYGAQGPLAAVVDTGGNAVTRAIAQELSIDHETAEKRKRILGCAGAGTGAHDILVAALAAAVERMRARTPVESVAVTGNGARLPNFAQDLESATGARTAMTVPALLEGPSYPVDVVRVAAPDWSLAAGLLAWSAAA